MKQRSGVREGGEGGGGGGREDIRIVDSGDDGDGDAEKDWNFRRSATVELEFLRPGQYSCSQVFILLSAPDISIEVQTLENTQNSILKLALYL